MKNLSVTLKVILLIGLIVAAATHKYWLPWVEDAARIFNILLGFLILILAINLSILLMLAVYRRGKKLAPRQEDNVTIGLQNVYYLIIAVITILTGASFFGLEPIEFITSLSIVAAAIAIISKDYISEIISGMILTFSRELEIGDYVKIGDQKGKIFDITLTKIALLNEDDDPIYLPNNKVYTSEIINYTRKEIKKVSIGFEMNLTGLKTVEELEAELTHALADYEDHIVAGSYNLRIVDIRKDSLSMKFQFVFRQMNRDLEMQIRRKTVRRIVNFIKSAQTHPAHTEA